MTNGARAALVHQAAHAVVAVCFNLPVPPVRAEPTEICGHLHLPTRPTRPTDLLERSVLKAFAVMFLAGPMAEFRTRGERLDAALDQNLDVVHSREIVSWVLTENPALLSAVMRGELTITTTDFLDVWSESISAVVSTSQREGTLSPDRTRQLLAPQIEHFRRLAAHHEAAHAVMLWLEGDGQVPLTIGLGRSPAESSQNFTVLRDFSREFYLAALATDPHDRELAVRELEHVVAGEEMALLLDPEYPGAVRAQGDRETAQRLAQKLADESRRSAQMIEAEARATVRQRFQEPRPRALVESLAEALLERTPLGEDEIRGLLNNVEDRFRTTGGRS